MSKSLRLSEKWFRRGLWLVAVVFAGFLIGLGGTVVKDLPRVERPLQLDDFMPASEAEPLRASVREAVEKESVAQRELEQAQLLLDGAQQASRNARDTFSNWLATRRATQLPEQDTELVARTRQLDALKTTEAGAQRKVAQQRQKLLDARQAQHSEQAKLDLLQSRAFETMKDEQRRVDLRVFLYRLALTLPLLLVAGWLFAKMRKSTYWPFVWGFIFFALFTFFVELVPYLPSYGGYVRYIVGIVVTVVVGRYAIVGLNRYLARQRVAEAQPDRMRREELSYDTALARLGKNVCPGCDRLVDLKNTAIDFCPHCGIGLFDHCRACNTRKSAFSRFCHGCGTSSQGAVPAVAPPSASAALPAGSG